MKNTLLIAAASVLLTACGGGGKAMDPGPGQNNNPNLTSKPTPKSQVEMNGFNDCTEYRDYYAEALTEEYLTGFHYGFGCWGCEPLTATTQDGAQPASSPGAAEDASFSSSRSPAGVSETNTQEAGVDEADIVEVDPRTGDLYILNRISNELLVVDAVPAEQMEIIARVQVPQAGYVHGMYLDVTNEKLVVVVGGGFYTVQGGGGASDTSSFAPSRGQSALLFYDVSDPTRPEQTGTFTIDGFPVDTRRVDGRVHLVSQFGFEQPRALNNDQDFFDLVYDEYPRALRNADAEEIERLQNEIRSKVIAAVQAAELIELLPGVSQNDGARQALACDAVQRPEVIQRLGMITITSIDTDGTDAATLGAFNNSWQVYASRDNIYLMQGSGGWWWSEEQTQQTAIYQFAVGAGMPQPRGTGLVDGWVNNSYSLSEYEGALRVATTESRFDRQDGTFDQTNHLFVLDASLTGNLNELGAVRDFIRDERIFSARFMGDVGYVVTFFLVDPLFTFDLSDPRNPRKVGEVEIPGFSTYIHPLGEDHLLTIGRAGGEGGQGVGNSFQLQIFDVSNLAEPRRVAVSEPDVGDDEWAFSLAEYDPHAFTYFDASGVLSIPVQIGSPDSSRSFSGFFAYDITTSSISEYTRIDHKQEGSGSSRCPSNGGDGGAPCSSFAPVIYNEPLRTVVIQEDVLSGGRTVLYTLSSAFLKALDANLVPTEIGELDIQPQ